MIKREELLKRSESLALFARHDTNSTTKELARYVMALSIEVRKLMAPESVADTPDPVRDLPGWIAITGMEPKDSAPFDGKPVLIATNHSWGSNVHRAIWTDAIHGEGIFGWAIEDCKHGPYSLRGYTVVSHWMPLPSFPINVAPVQPDPIREELIATPMQRCLAVKAALEGSHA